MFLFATSEIYFRLFPFYRDNFSEHEITMEVQTLGEIYSPRQHSDSKKTKEERENELIHNASLVRFPAESNQSLPFSNLSYKMVVDTRCVAHDLLRELFIDGFFSNN